MASDLKSDQSSAIRPLCISAAVEVLLKPLGYFDDRCNAKYSFQNEVDGGVCSSVRLCVLLMVLFAAEQHLLIRGLR